MRPQDLYTAAANHLAQQHKPDPYESNTGEERRYNEAREAVGQRAAILLDSVFDRFGEDVDGEQYFEDVEAGDYTWSGGSDVSIKLNGMQGDQTELTRRWVSLDIPAGEKFEIFAPDGCRVMKTLLIGAHDLRSSVDGGRTWDAPLRSASLEVITGLWTESDLEYVDFTDPANVPFANGPVILEILNDLHPVFHDNYDIYRDVFNSTPTRSDQTTFNLIEGIHAALDDFEKALA